MCGNSRNGKWWNGGWRMLFLIALGVYIYILEYTQDITLAFVAFVAFI